MEQMGRIISALRMEKNLSRRALVEGICSEHYLYMIEKGHRTPSVTILHRIGNRLSVCLFDYLEVEYCQDPVAMKRAMDQIAQMRRDFLVEELVGMEKEFSKLPDFRTEPWASELAMNRVLFLLLTGEKPRQITAILKSIKGSLERDYPDTIHWARFCGMAGLEKLGRGKYKEAEMTLSSSQQGSLGWLESNAGKDVQILLLSLNFILTMKKGDYSKALMECRKIKSLEKEWRSYELAGFRKYVSACCHDALGEEDECREDLLGAVRWTLEMDRGEEVRLIYRVCSIPRLLAEYGRDSELCRRLIGEYPFLGI